MPDLDGNIADLEAEIELLSDVAERCRKLMIVAQGSWIAGGVLLLLAFSGLADPVAFVFAVAASLGGIALFGSNKTTRDQVICQIKAHEARRAELIDHLDLREV